MKPKKNTNRVKEGEDKLCTTERIIRLLMPILLTTLGWAIGSVIGWAFGGTIVGAIGGLATV